MEWKTGRKDSPEVKVLAWNLADLALIPCPTADLLCGLEQLLCLFGGTHGGSLLTAGSTDYLQSAIPLIPTLHWYTVRKTNIQQAG